jgi:two-component system CheB/CheR fusion protein
LRRERKPIDIFLSALAKDRGEAAVAVVLSGGDGDGTLGVKAVKERGGLTLAQVANGDGPAHPDMPDSAISTGFIDFAIPAHEMGAKIAEFARSLHALEQIAGQDASAGEILDRARSEIYAILRNQVGHDFGGYKTKTFLRRVQRRMQVLHLNTIDGYVECLRQQPKEVQALFRDLLINVTNFFRDADAFETLASTVIPKLFEGRGADDTVRIWIPGCATGEEVFSIAILIREHMDTLTALPRVQLFATDIDEHALAVARAGRYPDALLDTISSERRERFFVLDGASYVLNKEIRDLCIFSPHSIIRDPPFSRIDLVSCRNLLIYFGADVQNEVIPIFHYSLRPGGYLFLGTSENVSQFPELFAALDKKHRIFRRRDDSMARVRLPLALGKARPAQNSIEGSARHAMLGGAALRQTVDAQVFEQFAPPHVVVNRDCEIVYFSPRTGKYIESATGTPTRQLLTMARKGLRLDLRTLFREAVETDQRTAREHLAVEGDDGRVQMVTMIIERVTLREPADPLYLILFVDEGPSLSREDAVQKAKPDLSGNTEHLERELRETRERLQSMIEEYETAIEELKSSNEELVSVNEELQSTNEELEASKEELQSLNEELHTVNAELTTKLDALDRANSDLENLFDSSQIATIFLDQNLVIRSFTPQVNTIFNILPADRGRPLTDLSSRLPLPHLSEDVRDVLSGKGPLERRITANEGDSHYLLRLVPYKTGGAATAGIVMTFVDVTGLTNAEAHQRTLIAELNHRVKNMLGIVLAIAQQTIKVSPSLKAFHDAYVPRLQAMSRSYELLSSENWTEASLSELVRLELAPFDLGRIQISGPEILLKPRQALSVGMILHELATNAAKYGALSNGSGTVILNWNRVGSDGAEHIDLRWLEKGGPPIAGSPDRRGFGLKLLDREAKYNLGGGATVDFAPGGLAADVRITLAGTGNSVL